MEVRADRAELPPDPKALQRITLRELVVRYRDTVSRAKRSFEKERFFLKVFLAHPICSKRLSDVCKADFVEYRDERLKTIKPISLKRELAPIHHLFEVARNEWALPTRENPIAQLRPQLAPFFTWRANTDGPRRVYGIKRTDQRKQIRRTTRRARNKEEERSRRLI